MRIRKWGKGTRGVRGEWGGWVERVGFTEFADEDGDGDGDEYNEFTTLLGYRYKSSSQSQAPVRRKEGPKIRFGITAPAPPPRHLIRSPLPFLCLFRSLPHPRPFSSPHTSAQPLRHLGTASPRPTRQSILAGQRHRSG